jgi:GntR family transcriptional regulator, phosphonate transport system regulatory protein
MISDPFVNLGDPRRGDVPMEIVRDGGVAVWRQIRQILEREIRERVFKPGDRLPTEADLARRFMVNRHTVRQALAHLEERGILRTDQGRGTFVQEAVIDYQVSRKTRFSENLSRQNRTSARVLLDTSEMPASTDIARHLRIRRGAPVAYVFCAGESDGRRISVSAHYFPLPRFAGIGDLMAQTRSFTQAVRRCGVEEYVRETTRILAKMPTGDEARLLSMPRNRPLVVTEGVNVDGAGARVEYCLTKFAGDLVQVLVEH